MVLQRTRDLLLEIHELRSKELTHTHTHTLLRTLQVPGLLTLLNKISVVCIPACCCYVLAFSLKSS